MTNATEETPMHPITDAQLDEIAARHKAATPGPWGSHRDLDGVYTIQARPRVTCAGMETDGDIATLAAGRTDAESYANARFIGHAREDVPALLAEVRRLRQQDAPTGQPEGKPRLLDCGLCFEEHGEEIHPHPACTVDRLAELEAEHRRWAAVHALVERAIDKGVSVIDTLDLSYALGPDAPVSA